MSTVGLTQSSGEGSGRIRDDEEGVPQKRVAEIDLAPQARSVRIHFEDGDAVVADMNAYIDEGGVFEQLDDPERFAEGEITMEGLVLEWPGDPPLDFDAAALWERFRSTG